MGEGNLSKKKIKLEWQKLFIGKVSTYSDKDLFEVFVNEFSEPDDHDGEWTGRGLWKRSYVINELRDRLFK
jgi:hypothetical protein